MAVTDDYIKDDLKYYNKLNRLNMQRNVFMTKVAAGITTKYHDNKHNDNTTSDYSNNYTNILQTRL